MAPPESLPAAVARVRRQVSGSDGAGGDSGAHLRALRSALAAATVRRTYFQLWPRLSCTTCLSLLRLLLLPLLLLQTTTC